ncbi:MAG TPA: plastocyanin/azurin family copper-binding protein [Actinomycetota bacterium]|nr:plastocyanin/azurin family copper-binding protein [Actinomycetota bacterium]
MRRPIWIPALALALVAAACGTATTEPGADASPKPTAGGATHGDEPMHGGSGTFAFGSPAGEAEADRTVEITAMDSLTFDPAAISVEKGEVVTFRVTNTGKIDHDFALGDEEFQKEHGQQMGGGGHHAEGTPAIGLKPGETKSLTWRFTTPGTVLYGCHVPGHYEAGMVGTITVQG